ncbi:hypothetical protein E2C01_053984 [Portunus trituberculatus]|uniref:Uncharacterized protein n=1 Tax=Portunus trituberculatus TaxID=210409 RepID=A0A5B7GIN8_PORTR|nr:hypothetical protein [Portunus trituberculatus]
MRHSIEGLKAPVQFARYFLTRAKIVSEIENSIDTDDGLIKGKKNNCDGYCRRDVCEERGTEENNEEEDMIKKEEEEKRN